MIFCKMTRILLNQVTAWCFNCLTNNKYMAEIELNNLNLKLGNFYRKNIIPTLIKSLVHINFMIKMSWNWTLMKLVLHLNIVMILLYISCIFDFYIIDDVLKKWPYNIIKLLFYSDNMFTVTCWRWAEPQIVIAV